jgi:hypothetical protein
MKIYHRLSMTLLLLILAPLAAFSQQAAQLPLLGSFESPGFITSAGQNSDAAIMKVLLNMKLKMGFGYDIAAKPEMLTSVKTLILVLGASNKGLGTAGLTIDQEMDRIKALLSAAKAQGTKIIAMHTGGSGRRGDASNDIISLCVPESAIVVVTSDGNQDGFFTSLCSQKGIPLVEVKTITEAGNVVKELMKK